MNDPDVEETLLHPAFARVYRTFPKLLWRDQAGDHEVVLEQPKIVGSSDRVPLRIAERSVSRLHAELEPKEDGVWVKDLGSRNGTTINGVLVRHARATHDSVVGLGDASIRIDYVHAEKRPVAEWGHDWFGDLFGRSPVMRELFAHLSRIAPGDAPVLITGETGTGKELVARAIHEASARSAAPLIVVDCAALPENLLESELYGYAKGAFTGAAVARAGVFEEAEGGTVFLDEIGEIPLALQPKLLRVLESKTVRRLGEAHHRPVNVRFVSATHRDLVAMVNEGSFREDLYFRLSVLPVKVPPLRERQEDIPLLMRLLLPPNAHGMLTPEVDALLASLPWRGNVRELRNFAARANVLGVEAALGVMREEDARRQKEIPSSGPMSSQVPPRSEQPSLVDITPTEHFGGVPPERPVDPAVFDLLYKDFRDQWIDSGEREYIRRRLLRHGHNITAISREIELARAYVYRLIKKHGL